MTDELNLPALVYVTGDERAVVAVRDDGTRVGLMEPSDFGGYERTIKAMRDWLIESFGADGVRVMFVPDPYAHPVVRELLNLHDAPPEQTTDQGKHICAVCTHAHVCRGAAIALELDAKISACAHHAPTSESETQ